ncbi:LytR C-terminal domain-containing protein [Streptomyces sp. W1SF4]|uniref:LCP family protein n=1 Tax=Streptomyces sp. W1SF4 TaxID=2305220 RepID=UPI000F6DF053|nr:LytR C-terminal domain-containing protein [Streptomyces sp. W1SF4]AZM89131.1 LytR family transcriptional regulator [Streptomyces sp. W1SF4]
MNDPQDPYDPYAAQQQLIGYDAYGRPVYGQVTAQPVQPAQPVPHPYEQQYAAYPQYPQYEQPYPEPQPPDPYPGPPDPAQWIPHQAAPQQQPAQAPAPAPVPEPRRAAPAESAAGVADAPGGRDYRTEQFSFIDQPDEDSEDVIDWLAFTESRTERREEARRRGRNRVVALVVVLALSAVGGLGYLWYTGGLPFLDGPGRKKPAAAAAGAQKRDMIVVHLHNTKRGGSSTALLVDNVTTGQGATVLIPNTLGVPQQDGTATTLGKAVEEGGLGTRESLDTVLGTRIGGTWRLDTPFLERLVELVGGIEADTDAAVPADEQAKTPAVAQGPKQSLTGAMAVAYATYRGRGEPEAKQLERTGRVLYAVLRKIPGDPGAAATTVESMGQILDPGLDAKNLGGLLSRIGEHAKVAAYRTEVLTVKPDGGLTDEAGRKVVKEVLGGSFGAAQPGASPRVGLKDATGDEKAQVAAKAALLNGGYGFVDGGRADRTAAATRITYQDQAQRDRAVDVAKTLGLPESAVQKAESPVNADVVVVLGKDYKPS